MKKIVSLSVAVLAAAIPGGSVGAESYGIQLSAQIPVICVLNHVGAPANSADTSVSLGSLREFCNAPRGYDLVINYTPGSLRGARITAGSSQIMLDGSGQSTIGHSPMPRIREVPISAAPGENGFDTDRVEFRLVPAS